MGTTFWITVLFSVFLGVAGVVLKYYGRRKEKYKQAKRANEDLREDAKNAALPPRRGSDLLNAGLERLRKKNK